MPTEDRETAQADLLTANRRNRARSGPRAMRMAGLAALDAYRGRLVAEGRGVPASPNFEGEIWWSQVRRETGLSLHATLPNGFARNSVEALAKELGLSQPTGVETITIGRFKEIALRERGAALRARVDLDEPSRKKAMSNLRWALNRVSENPKSAASAREGIEAVLAGLTAAQGSLRAELRSCLTLLGNYELDADLPQDFAAALRMSAARMGFKYADLAAAVGVTPSAMRQWATGRVAPTRRRLHAIASMERALKLPEGTLASRVRFRKSGNGSLPRKLPVPAGFEPRTKLRRRLVSLLPIDFEGLPPKERDAALAEGCRIALEEKRAREHAKVHVYDARYRLNVWPDRLEREWEDCVEFKSDAVLARAEDLREGILWRDGSFQVTRSLLNTLFGFLTSEHSRFRVEAEDLTFAILIYCKKYYNLLLKFRSNRNMVAKNDGKGYITNADLQCLSTIRSLLKPQVGWLAQRPELAGRLVPVEGFVTVEDVMWAQANWSAACTTAHRDCKLLIKSFQGFVKPGRDSHLPVIPILKMDNPLEALHQLNVRLQRECDAAQVGRQNVGTLLRQRIMAGILAQYPLRPETLSRLDYLPDNSGHLRREGSVWKLQISRFLFKNYKSTYFQVGIDGWRDFEEDLIDGSGLYGALEQYVAWGRAAILAGTRNETAPTRTDALFVTTPNLDAEGRPLRRERTTVRPKGGKLAEARDPGRMTAVQIADRFQETTGRFLAWNEGTGEGIKGVRPFSPQACRHIVATGVLKLTRDWEAAADAIQDNVLMVRTNYGRYLPTDRRHIVRSALRLAYRPEDGSAAV